MIKYLKELLFMLKSNKCRYTTIDNNKHYNAIVTSLESAIEILENLRKEGNNNEK